MPIEKGGSDRKFYRIQFSPEQSIVLVKYTGEQSENQRYVRDRGVPRGAGNSRAEDLFPRSGGRADLAGGPGRA